MLLSCIDTPVIEGYNVLKVMWLMAVGFTISCGSSNTQNGGGTLRYGCEVY
jgi:hypothetical protein